MLLIVLNPVVSFVYECGQCKLAVSMPDAPTFWPVFAIPCVT